MGKTKLRRHGDVMGSVHQISAVIAEVVSSFLIYMYACDRHCRLDECMCPNLLDCSLVMLDATSVSSAHLLVLT